MNLKKHKDTNGNYYEFTEVKQSATTIFIHGVKPIKKSSPSPTYVQGSSW